MRAERQRTVPVLGTIFFFAAVSVAQAESCEKSVGRLVSLQGTVEARPSNQAVWQAAKLNDKFCPGDAIRTGARSRAAMVLANETIVRLDQHTTLTLTGLDDKSTSWIDLLSGMAHFLSRTPRALKVKTPYINAGVEGTEFVVRTGASEGSVSVLEGRVLAENAQGSATLVSGESAAAAAGQAPVKHLVVQIRDAVQWSLYYPPLFEGSALAGSESWAEAARRSAAAYLAGDSAAAFAAITSVPNSVSDSRFFNYRAGLLLSVGRVDEAQADISRSLQLSTDNAHALALQSVLALARADSLTALDLARKANTRDPASVSAWVALSYAQQAAFDLDDARASMQQAVHNDPTNALAWARLAELWLALGDLEQAQEAADRAVSINTNIARTQTVRGFASLTRIKTVHAQRAFETAISQDSADPLARLGLGLALIRQGHLGAGRREIEIAAALDPNNALIRSYLGKAYYEEKRNHLATAQLDMAKLLDPTDPTPWFYDAIRKQTENRPVEALTDLQKSIELNDNRAVYRSRLLLDQDLAARSASQARIYSDLGFQQLALVEGWKSVNTDPANHSAHRFLADSYAGLPRHEIGRVSELLQAQLLQPLNLNPVQPQLAESRFNAMAGGPAASGFNEFTPLYVSEGFALRADGVGGSHGTWGDELTLSGVHGATSWSVGQLHYQTDGIRRNADYEQNLYNVFGQIALSPSSSLQAEIRLNEVWHGDISQRLNPALYPNNRYDRRNGTARLGYHQQLDLDSDFLASVIFRQSKESQHLEEILDPTTLLSADVSTQPKGYLTEVQHLFRRPTFNVISGFGYYDQKSSTNTEYVTSSGGVPLPPPFSGSFTTDSQIQQTNAYVYSQLASDRSMVLSVGVSYDNFQLGSKEKSQFNPKLGLIWNPVPDTTLRFAAFRTLKRALLSDQTLEPTQVAGFAQFFDDLNATDAMRYGAALDQRFGKAVWGGVELSHRDLELITDFLNNVEEEARENLARFYLYWVINPHWVFGTEYFLEGYEREVAPPALTQPKELATHRLPLTLNYFHPAGWFGGVKLSPLIQKAELPDGFGAVYPDDDRFWLTDISLGYRLPARRGLVSLTVQNLFDREFRYQDSNFQTNEPQLSPILPERTVLARLLLVF